MMGWWKAPEHALGLVVSLEIGFALLPSATAADALPQRRVGPCSPIVSQSLLRPQYRPVHQLRSPGLETGQPFSYADDDPVNGSDPSGLDCGGFVVSEHR